ncbi:hypothetical protein [uncultured Bilophila sp.]|uniref:hypothetical protein n=1 Tax=uncultured Bilophila sp. TaxID=529385 RepID=UPI00280C2643|nr:hypothetical protein [uncultured Bilophila sp.]
MFDLFCGFHECSLGCVGVAPVVVPKEHNLCQHFTVFPRVHSFSGSFRLFFSCSGNGLPRVPKAPILLAQKRYRFKFASSILQEKGTLMKKCIKWDMRFQETILIDVFMHHREISGETPPMCRKKQVAWFKKGMKTNGWECVLRPEVI